MQKEKYKIGNIKVSDLLSDIRRKAIAVPEIQRPFVWKRSQVRDLMDSLYRGYPTGYLIVWHNPSVRLKDGKESGNKTILIDGQQRVTALMAALAGEQVVNSDYKKEHVTISFDPFAALAATENKDAEMFKVKDSGIEKSDRWIKDISEIFKPGFKRRMFENEYCRKNPSMSADDLDDILTDLLSIATREFGMIELDRELDIDLVTDIFIRVNSKGTTLSQGDFVMSKIASDDEHGGNKLRKLIDYFSHMSIEPAFYSKLSETDLEFANSDYMRRIAWLKKESEDVFDPTCDDVIRVAFMDKYPRAKLSDLVGLLSGRDFETREYREEIIDETYQQLEVGVLDVVNENNFKNFMAALRGAGFISPKLVNSRMSIDFAYMIYLRLSRSREVPVGQIKGIVQRWYVYSVLTGRYSSSPESVFYKDLKSIKEQNSIVKVLEAMEATLSKTFWTVEVPEKLKLSSTVNPTDQVFYAAQVVMKDVSLLSNNIFVGDLVRSAGDVHHIFPKAYLCDHNFGKSQYNQKANLTYLDNQVNKAIGKKAPKEYFTMAFKQCHGGPAVGSISDLDQLRENLRMNCIPEEVINWDFRNYDEFLERRRQLMAAKIRKYYESL